MSDCSVAIIMATYNGIEYLKEQVESIVAQTHQRWRLLVSDDCSTDGTLELLQKMADDDSRIVVTTNSGDHGAYNNYYNAIDYYRSQYGCDDDYYFFCDQDDRWETDKIELEIEELRSIEKRYGISSPALCYSDLELMSTTGEKLGMKMSDLSDIRLDRNPYNLFFSHCYVWGTTAALNKALWKVVITPKYGRNDLSHDNWYAKHAILIGHIGYVDKPLVFYRRHVSNVTPLPKKYNPLSAFRKMLTFPDVVDAQAHIYWSSLRVLDNVETLDYNASRLKRALQNGGPFAMRYMFKERICPGGGKYNQLARYIDLGLCLHKRTKWFTQEEYKAPEQNI